MRKTFAIAAALLSALPALAPLSAQAPAGISGQGVVWHEDLDSALKAAKASHKAVFVDIWAEWCPPCQRMRQSVFPTPQAQAALKKVEAASILVEKKDHTPIPGGVAVDQRYGSGAYPTLLLLDADGKVLRKHTGSLDAAGLAKFISND